MVIISEFGMKSASRGDRISGMEVQIKLILSSPNVVLTFYTYKVSNKKVSS
jgi:hypothetical protein